MSILDLDAVYALFCSVDAFWRAFEPHWERELLAAGRKRRRATQLHPSEIMTIAILFQQSHYRTFKAFYTEYVQAHLHAEFPRLVSYTRFIELLPRFLLPLAVYLHTQYGPCTGISFIDSTGFHSARGVPSSPDPPASRLSGGCAARQNIGGLVLRLQTPSGGQ